MSGLGGTILERNLAGCRNVSLYGYLTMPLNFCKDENTGRILITGLPVTRMAGPVVEVHVGLTPVGRAEQFAGGHVELFLHKALRESGRPFLLDEILNEEGRVSSIELNWI